MQTIQQKLADRIYELLPEKKELEFGCEVEYCDDGYEPRKVTIGDPYQVVKNKVVNPYNPDDQADLYKIIGQPIRLADVLMAVEFGSHETLNDISFPLINLYDISQDNILNQSNKFCEFVYNLIK